MRRLLLLLLGLSLTGSALCCTTAVISGRATHNGKPLLWKHRDTGTEWNHIEHFRGERYSFTGLVNSSDRKREAVWAGANERGFAIMNNASYNLKPDSLKHLPENEGVVMKLALGRCATVDEFEELLRTLPEPRCLEANFGVIDAQGGATYFEVWDYGYTRFDADDRAIAPDGYLLRTNFSFSGEQDEGMGYVRYQNAEYLFHRAYARGELTPEWILDGASRSFYNALLGTDLCTPEGRPAGGWAIDQDYIPRRSSSASIVIEGVRAGDDPAATVLWCALGYSPCTYAVAAWVAAGDELPACLTAEPGGHAPVNELAVALKRRAFPVRRGNGPRYLHIGLLDERIMPLVREAEAEEFRVAREAMRDMRKGFDRTIVKAYNRGADQRFARTAAGPLAALAPAHDPR